MLEILDERRLLQRREDVAGADAVQRGPRPPACPGPRDLRAGRSRRTRRARSPRGPARSCTTTGRAAPAPRAGAATRRSAGRCSAGPGSPIRAASPSGSRSPWDRLVPIPASIDPIHAASMSCALGTAYRSVITRGGVGAGMTAAIVGLGGVGIHAAQIGRAAGARIDLLRHPRAHDRRRAGPRSGRRARRRRGRDRRASSTRPDGEGVDVVVDTVGHDDTLALARRLVRPGGRVVGVGYTPDILAHRADDAARPR